MRRTCDVLVIGAGAIGCSVAWRLAQKKLRVVVCDPAGPAGEASSVAAGILTNLEAVARRDPTAAMGLESLRRFPSLAGQLKEETGVDPLYRRTGFLLLDPGGWPRQFPGLRVEPVPAQRLRELEPRLRAFPAEALFEPEAATIRARNYTLALAEACRRAGVRFLAERALAFGRSRDRILEARTDRGALCAGAFALCAGAWSGALAAALGCRIPVAPARGQLLLLESPPDLLRHPVELGGRYLSPWDREAVLAGTTVERVGFRRGTTPAAMADLARFASRMLPALAGARALGRLSGFRPEPVDGLPLLGRPPRWSNLWLACGHFRQGIILSPWTGENLARWIYEGREAAGFAAFSPGRFSRSATDEMEATASAPAAHA